jgi:hypothetical protein
VPATRIAMTLRIIRLDPADTFYSVRDRLLQSGRGRTVLVWPDHGPSLGEVQWTLMRRLADRERLEIGLVTTDRTAAQQARAAGLPVFAGVGLAERYRPGWRRPGRRMGPGLPPGEARRLRDQADRLPTAVEWPATIARLIILAAALVLILVGAATLIPQATVTARPQTQPVQIIADLTADPALAEPEGLAVPARGVEISQSWEARGIGDRQSLRALARQELDAAAPRLLAARLAPGETLVPTSVRVEIVEESFHRNDGEAILRLEAVLNGYVVATADLEQIGQAQLAAAAPAGFVPDSVHVVIEPDGDSPNQFQITARATTRAVIDPTMLAAQLRGLSIGEALGVLEDEMPVTDAAFDVTPWWWSWFGRLPLRVERIRVELLP